MKIAFLIPRDAQYRLLAPVIEAALQRGWTVECWHDYSQLTGGHKAYLFPSVDTMPTFRNGRPEAKPYQGPRELTIWLREMRADVVVFADYNAFELPLPERRPLVVCHQHFIDSLAFHGPEGVLAWDLLALFSSWWLDWTVNLFQLEGQLSDAHAFRQRAEAASAVVGLPELDAAELVDPVAVRRKWNIPESKPVVVLLPFPQGVGRQAFWPRRICAEPSRMKQLLHMAASRRFEYWRDVYHGWNDANVVKALRAFCDRNGAFLLVKSRRKTPIPAYTEALADLCVYDEQYYPATILEALSIASLSVSYYSNSVFESVALGVPHLCVTYSAKDYNEKDAHFFSTFYTPDEGSAFQFAGAARAWTIAETIKRLPAASFADFAMESDARSAYMRKFVTHDDRKGGGHMMDAIERALRGRGAAMAGASA